MAWTLPLLVGITLVKLWATEYIGPDTPFLLYLAAIIAAAWHAGWAGGLVASAVSALLVCFFFLPPFHSFGLADPVLAVRLGVFLIEGVAIIAITARLHAERGVAKDAASRAHATLADLEKVLHGVADGITVQTERGELVYANESAAKLTGFPSAEALLAAPVSEIMERFELLAPDGSPLPADQLPGRRVLKGLPGPETQVRFRVRNTGEERWAIVHANAVRFQENDLLCVVNVFQDITDMRRQEDALRVSREWFSTTLQSIGDAVIATDAKGRVTFMNGLAERLTAWNAQDAAGKPLPEVFHILAEYNRQLVENPVDRVLREGKVVGLANHTILIGRNGVEVNIDDSAAPIRSTKGELVGTVLVFRDVSERRAEELRRSFIAKATAELASSLDYKHTLATVARLAVPTIADWCAVDIAAEDGLERLAVEHVDPEKVRLVFDIQRRYPPDRNSPSGTYQVLRTGEPTFISDIPDAMLVAAARDEEHLALIRKLELHSYLAVPLKVNQRVLGVLTLAMAESARRYGPRDLEVATQLADRAALAVGQARLFEDTLHARTEAERANRAKDEFLAMLGHELRNPLAPILTALELMKTRAPTVLERERAVLERQVKHLVTLVDDLLDVSRIARGKVELAKERVDLADTVGKALELAGPVLAERQHEIIREVAEGLVVVGDSVRLSQVLANLLTNAAKYTPAGGRIEVLGERRGAEVLLRVRDNGVGIAPDLLPRVFDLFVQGGQSLDRAQGGLGLGLAIVRSVVELHGGKVFADSAGPGQGSEFRIVLPAAGEMAAPSDVPVAGVSRSPERRLRVLVVDDNQDALELLAEALVLLGHEAVTAPDAATGLDRAEASKPDVGLLDIGLPGMDGYELCRRLRATPGLQSIKLVAITGYGQAADRAQAAAAGFDQHMVKPISVESLQKLLDRLAPS